MIAMDCLGSNQCAPFWSKVVATVSRSHGFQIQTFPRDNSQTNLTSIQLCVRRVKNAANYKYIYIRNSNIQGGSSLTFVLPPYPYILDNITKLHLNESIFRIFLPFPSWKQQTYYLVNVIARPQKEINFLHTSNDILGNDQKINVTHLWQVWYKGLQAFCLFHNSIKNPICAKLHF